jgi:hypothetical protein
MKTILDRSFHYTSSVATDLRKTFARIRREQRKQIGSCKTGTNAMRASKTEVVPIRRAEVGRQS